MRRASQRPLAPELSPGRSRSTTWSSRPRWPSPQHFIEDFFAKAESMPGFSSGMAKVSHDEQRHIGFGVKVLSELFAESEECKAAATEILRGDPPVHARGDDAPRLGRALHHRLRLHPRGHPLRSGCARSRRSGAPPATRWTRCRPGSTPSTGDAPLGARRPPDQAAAARGARRAQPQARRDPEVEEILFDVIARSAHTDAVDRPLTIQWRFEDAEPWHVRIDNGSTQRDGRPGRRSRHHPAHHLGRLDRRRHPGPRRQALDAPQEGGSRAARSASSRG